MASPATSLALCSLGGHPSAPVATQAPPHLRAALQPFCLRHSALVATHLRTVAAGVSNATTILGTAGKDGRSAAAARLLALLHIAAAAWPTATQHAASARVGAEPNAAASWAAQGATEVLRAAQHALLSLKQPLLTVPDVVAAAACVGELLRGCLKHVCWRVTLQVRQDLCTLCLNAASCA